MPIKPKMFDKNAEITVESVLKKLNEIVSARGKKGTNKAEMVRIALIKNFLYSLPNFSLTQSLRRFILILAKRPTLSKTNNSQVNIAFRMLKVHIAYIFFLTDFNRFFISSNSKTLKNWHQFSNCLEIIVPKN